MDGLDKLKPNEKHSKIDVDRVKNYYSEDSHFKPENAVKRAIQIDKLKILQSVLSKDLPPERYNGLINLSYVFVYPNATTEEIESALVI